MNEEKERSISPYNRKKTKGNTVMSPDVIKRISQEKIVNRKSQIRKTVGGDRYKINEDANNNGEDEWYVKENTYNNFAERGKSSINKTPARLVSLNGIYEEEPWERNRIVDRGSMSRLSSANKLTYIGGVDQEADNKITLNKMLEIMTINDFTWFKSSRQISQSGRYCTNLKKSSRYNQI